jgi:hypothetical protein
MMRTRWLRLNQAFKAVATIDPPISPEDFEELMWRGEIRSKADRLTRHGCAISHKGKPCLDHPRARHHSKYDVELDRRFLQLAEIDVLNSRAVEKDEWGRVIGEADGIFVYGNDLRRIFWPAFDENDGKTRKNTGGRPRTMDWERIVRQLTIWGCTGQLPEKRADCLKMILAWISDQGIREPTASELNLRIKQTYEQFLPKKT